VRVHTLVVHHSASPRSTTVEQIREWHAARWRSAKNHPGYHYCITGDGEIHATRPTHLVGIHAPPNTGRLGVCVIGDNTSPGREWNPLQWQALADLVRAIRVVWPSIEVVAHRDVRQTQCPGLTMETIAKEIGLR